MEKCKCGGYYYFSNHCGAHVCMDCSHHKGLSNCYCGWSAGGGDGRRNLEEMGETIDPEPEIPGEGDDMADPGPFPDEQPAYQEGEYVDPANVTSSSEYAVTGITRRYT